MKPFNLEKALAGEKVVTRDGREVKRIVHDTEAFCVNLKVSALVKTCQGFKRISYYETGGYSYAYDNPEHPLDLFMAPKKKTVWCNFFRRLDESMIVAPKCYDSEDQAKMQSSDSTMKYIGTFPVEITYY